MLISICPHCNGQIQDDGTLAGQQVSCPHCTRLLVMPSLPPEGLPLPLSNASDNPFHIDTSSSNPSPSTGNTYSQRGGQQGRSRSRKKKNNKVLYIVLGVGALFVLGVVGAAVDEGSTSKTDFKNNTKSYKGKTVTLTKMRFQSNAGLRTWKKVAVKRGFVIGDQYMAVFTGSPDLQVAIFIPFDMNVPNVDKSYKVTIKFKCTEGNPKWGNKLISLKVE